MFRLRFAEGGLADGVRPCAVASSSEYESQTGDIESVQERRQILDTMPLQVLKRRRWMQC